MYDSIIVLEDCVGKMLSYGFVSGSKEGMV